MNEALTSWEALSSTGLVGELIKLAEAVGDWAGAASDLIGLVG